jgi:hypothetical protein
MKTKNIVQTLIFLVIVGVSYWGVTNQQAIRDWWILRSYSPPAQIVAFAEATTLSDKGKNIFYASQPELNTSDSFNANCQFAERSVVLGCYNQWRIYIYEVNDPRLEGVEDVTAAHELLHAAYVRLGDSDRERIDTLIQKDYSKIDDERIRDTVKNYEADDSASVPNELHSILGTEVATLSPELEQYYSQYFSDRQQVVSIALSYEAVFTGIRAEIDKLDQRIADIRSQIDIIESQLADQQSELEAESSRLNALKNGGQIESFNAAVPSYNANVAAFNSLITKYKGLVKDHNEYVSQRNDLALEQNDLIHSLDSKYQKID